MSISDANFWAAIDVLNRINIRFWVSHGTLLGLTRDNQLIPWDRDIDFTAFGHDDSPVLRDRVRHLFTEAGFKHVKDEVYNIQFTRLGGRKVDLNFCSKFLIHEKEYWVQQWLVPVPRILSRSATQFLYNFPRKLDRLFSSRLTPLVQSCVYKFEYRSYKIPAELLNDFENVIVDERNVPVPAMREAILEELYGSGWRVPIESDHWADFAVKDQSRFG